MLGRTTEFAVERIGGGDGIQRQIGSDDLSTECESIRYYLISLRAEARTSIHVNN